VNYHKQDIGTEIFIVGNPLDYNWVFSKGMITGYMDNNNYFFDAPINFGNSGGPIVNSKLEVIGIVDAFVSDAHELNIGARIGLIPTNFKKLCAKKYPKPEIKITPEDNNLQVIRQLDILRTKLVQNNYSRLKTFQNQYLFDQVYTTRMFRRVHCID
jgi:S1-C subfamily serine protease